MDKEQEMLDCIFELEEKYKTLKEQNTRLQSELDKYIRMASDYEKALKEYADESNYAELDMGFAFCSSDNWTNEGLAQEVLEKWENK